MRLTLPGVLPTTVVETHTAIVLFFGERAYKVKKPLRFPFLDFSTAQLRELACRREVALNRRIAPDVYLGVATVSEPDGREPAEYMVVMRRMPKDRSLAVLAAQQDPALLDHVRDVARVVAGFHATAERNAAIDRFGPRNVIANRWKSNFDEMAPFAAGSERVFDPEQMSRAQALVDEFLLGRDAFFAHRVDEGFVCDGHGDLQAADVYCLDDGPRILDCIEFDDSLRYVDVADDVAFLIMDLERLGATQAGQHLQNCYAEFAGHPLPRPLVHHYVAYRAQVRAKVAALRWNQVRQSDEGAARESTTSARQLLDLCVHHLEQARVRLVIVGGLPGTGKTTLAAELAARRGWTVLRSDAIRKETAGLDSTTRADAAYGAGLYEPSISDAVYSELFERARIMLGMGESVALDASWTSARHRARARALAAAQHAHLSEIECVIDRAIANDRLVARRAGANDASDATPQVAARMAAVQDPWPEARRVTTDRPAAELAAELADRI
jgi:aminoglycoside phosphotransferase family enzyme/predicted kinase